MWYKVCKLTLEYNSTVTEIDVTLKPCQLTYTYHKKPSVVWFYMMHLDLLDSQETK